MQGQGFVDGESGLTKVVLARRSDVAFRGTLDPLMLLAALQVWLARLITCSFALFNQSLSMESICCDLFDSLKVPIGKFSRRLVDANFSLF